MTNASAILRRVGGRVFRGPPLRRRLRRRAASRKFRLEPRSRRHLHHRLPIEPEGAVPQMGVEEGGSAYPSARTGGKLVLDDRGCLRIKASADASGEVPLWPSYTVPLC